VQQSNDRSSNLRRLGSTDYTVAGDEPDVRGWTVVDTTGRPLGSVGELIIDTDARKVRYFELRDTAGPNNLYAPVDGADLDTAHQQVVLRSSGSLMNSLPDGSGVEHRSAADQATSARSTGSEKQRLTRAEEELRIGKRTVQAGEVRIGKHVETEHVHDDVTLLKEQVHVERRPVTGAAPTEIRASGEEIRVPIIEEEVVVEKRPVVKEELIVSKEQVQESRPVDVERMREEFDIHRDDETTMRDARAKRGGR
jgi:uncharacterized protein (TIGR02271 family)